MSANIAKFKHVKSEFQAPRQAPREASEPTSAGNIGGWTFASCLLIIIAFVGGLCWRTTLKERQLQLVDSINECNQNIEQLKKKKENALLELQRQKNIEAIESQMVRHKISLKKRSPDQVRTPLLLAAPAKPLIIPKGGLVTRLP
jgi:uncharacterized protein HemX